jgi:hypothetical protein
LVRLLSEIDLTQHLRGTGGSVMAFEKFLDRVLSLLARALHGMGYHSIPS